MNYKMVEKEIFPLDKLESILEKFKKGDYNKIHIKKLENNKYWEARYLKSIKGEE